MKDKITAKTELTEQIRKALNKYLRTPRGEYFLGTEATIDTTESGVVEVTANDGTTYFTLRVTVSI